MALGMGQQGMSPMQNRNIRAGMNRYPAPPALSRSLSMGEAIDNQFGNYNNNNMSMGSSMTSAPGMARGNPNFNHNWTSEQQQMMMMQKQHQQQQQQQQQQTGMMQQNIPQNMSQQQQQSSMQARDFSLMDRTQQMAMNRARMNEMASPSKPVGQPLPPYSHGNDFSNSNDAVFNRTPKQQTKSLQGTIAESTLMSPKNSRTSSTGLSSSNNANTSDSLASSMSNSIPVSSPPVPNTDDADLDSILDNPPEEFDLLKMLS